MPTPTTQAIEHLTTNPATAGQFDEVFGQGASAQYLQTPEAVETPEATTPEKTGRRTDCNLIGWEQGEGNPANHPFLNT